MKAKHLEVLGGAFLLLSFTMQNFVYDKWNSRSELLRKEILERAVLDKSVLLNEVLYFAVDTVTEPFTAGELADLRRQKIAEAARKLSYSAYMPVFSANLTVQEKVSAKDELDRHALQVRDYRSYAEYIGFVNNVLQTIPQPAALLLEVEQERKSARNLFLGIYILGTIILLTGIARRSQD